MPIVSISLSSQLLKQLDGIIQHRGYSSRSEAIRDAVRKTLSEFEQEQLEGGRVTATITAISAHNQPGVDERLTRLRHSHNHIVSGNMHLHLGETYCLEVFITEGKVEDVLDFIGRVRAMRGLYQVKYTIMPLKD
jgi:CopG family nickel-responsive transcriptional regulator